MRKLRFVSLLTIVVLLLAACGGGAAAPAAPAPAAPAAEATKADTAAVTETTATTSTTAAAPAADAGAKEAPALAELVKAGKLPALDERLPKEPFVVGPGVLISKEDLPNWEPGQYGGTINTAHSVADWAPDVFVMLNEPLLQAPGLSVQEIGRASCRERV